MLRIWLFGAVSYAIDGAKETHLADLRYPRVVAYLALDPTRSSTKSVIQRAAWGARGAGDNLRRAMRGLRRDHPELAEYIVDEGRTMGFDTSAVLEVDVLRFDNLVQARRYDEALGEVRGGFLSDVPEGLAEWIDSERRRWNGQAARVCQLLAARDWHDAAPETAIRLSRQAAQLAPADPDAAIGLAAYLAASGQRQDAMNRLKAVRNERAGRIEPEHRRLDDAIRRLDAGEALPVPERPSLPARTPQIDKQDEGVRRPAAAPDQLRALEPASTSAKPGHPKAAPRENDRRAFAAGAAALVLVVVGVVVGLLVLADARNPSDPHVEQPWPHGIASGGPHDARRAMAYRSLLHGLEPSLALSFDREQLEMERTQDAVVTGHGVFGGASDAALSGDIQRRVATLPPVPALVGGTPRTIVVWIRTDVRGRQTLLDAGRSSTAGRMLLALTDPASVPQAPDRRNGVVLVLYDSDVFLPGVDIADNRWHQIAVVLERARGLIMVDGELPPAMIWDGARYEGPREQPVTLPSSPSTTKTRVSLTGAGPGTRTSTWRRGFSGQIDELAIFDRALPPEVIKQLWRAAGGNGR